ncbi:metallophosphoesterase family protein [Chloroflexota bacterium]
MRSAIIADIHGNLAAFSAVLNDIARREDVAEIWSLGDIVGYGPDPHECLVLLRQCNHIGIAGNHDLAAIGKADLAIFNPDAAAACRWTAQQLSVEDKEYLEGLPLTVQKEDLTLVHGSRREPAWEYILSTGVALENSAFFSSQVCLVGHSHSPAVFKQDGDTASLMRFRTNVGILLGQNRLIINPGSVGQPRDGDPRASYVIYDSDIGMFRLYRVEYDVEATQRRMVKAGLPLRLVSRNVGAIESLQGLYQTCCKCMRNFEQRFPSGHL